MTAETDQRRYWDAEAPSALFTHPLNVAWIERIAQPRSAFLDFGCGYGRTLAELHELGYTDVTGFDPSEAMLDRAAEVAPHARLVHATSSGTPFSDDAFDVVLLFAVLTATPRDSDQLALVRDLYRILRPGGHLYVSDYPVQDDPRRAARYREERPDDLPFGAFRIDGGRAVMRHHTDEWLEALFSDFESIERRAIAVETMLGRPATAFQWLLCKPLP